MNVCEKASNTDLPHQNHHHVANVQVPWLVVSVSGASSLTALAQSRRERAEEVVEEEEDV